MAQGNSDSKTIRQVAAETLRDMERDGGSSNQIGPKGPPKISPPPHMADPALGGGYVNDNAAATRARNQKTDDNLSSVPPARKA